MKKLFLLCAVAILSIPQSFAQDLDAGDFQLFNHLSGGVTLGTDGIGIEVAAPLTYNFSVRMGYSFMPKFKYSKSINAGTDIAFLAYPNSQDVDVEGKLNMGDFKLLFDWYPFQTSSFHVTAGAYLGKSKVVDIYNASPFIKQDSWGSKGLELGSGANTYTLVSNAKTGDVRAEVKTNSFKPYVGVGFGRAVPKGRVGVQFDLGVQFWGKPEVWGDINKANEHTGMFETNYEKIDKNRITNSKSDYQDIKDAIDKIERVGVYPVLTLRINGRIF